MRRTLAKQEAAQARHEKLQDRLRKASAKDAARLKIEADIQEAADLTRECEADIGALRGLLSAQLTRALPLDLDRFKKRYTAPPFDESPFKLQAAEPTLELSPPPGFFGRLLPSVVQAHEQSAQIARRTYSEAMAKYRAEQKKLARLREEARSSYLATCHTEEQEMLQYNQNLDSLQAGAERGDPDAVTQYLELVIETATYPAEFPHSFRIAMLPDSEHVVIEYRLPDYSAMPQHNGFKYVRTSQTIVPVALPDKQRRQLYVETIAQATLGVLATIFQSNLPSVKTTTFNGMVETVDPRTGKDVQICVISVRVTKDVFVSLDLRRVDAIACLRELRASVSRNPEELVAVKPLLGLHPV